MKPKQLYKDQSIIYRYPRASSIAIISAALLTFFSKPLYDAFFNKNTIDLEELRRTHKTRFGKS